MKRMRKMEILKPIPESPIEYENNRNKIEVLEKAINKLFLFRTQKKIQKNMLAEKSHELVERAFKLASDAQESIGIKFPIAIIMQLMNIIEINSDIKKRLHAYEEQLLEIDSNIFEIEEERDKLSLICFKI